MRTILQVQFAHIHTFMHVLTIEELTDLTFSLKAEKKFNNVSCHEDHLVFVC